MHTKEEGEGGSRGEGRVSRNREKRRKYELETSFLQQNAVHLVKQYKSVQSSFSQITEADRIT